MVFECVPGSRVGPRDPCRYSKQDSAVGGNQLHDGAGTLAERVGTNATPIERLWTGCMNHDAHASGRSRQEIERGACQSCRRRRDRYRYAINDEQSNDSTIL